MGIPASGEIDIMSILAKDLDVAVQNGTYYWYVSKRHILLVIQGLNSRGEWNIWGIEMER